MYIRETGQSIESFRLLFKIIIIEIFLSQLIPCIISP